MNARISIKSLCRTEESSQGRAVTINSISQMKLLCSISTHTKSESIKVENFVFLKQLLSCIYLEHLEYKILFSFVKSVESLIKMFGRKFLFAIFFALFAALSIENTNVEARYLRIRSDSDRIDKLKELLKDVS